MSAYWMINVLGQIRWGLGGENRCTFDEYIKAEDTVIENKRKLMTPSVFERQSTCHRRLACSLTPSPNTRRRLGEQ